MSDLLPGVQPESLSTAEVWSPNDQLLATLEGCGGLTNPAVVSLALGLSLSRQRVSAFIPASWLAGAHLLIPTAGGVPMRAGRLKVMPVFTDAEALRAWLPPGTGADHPCFGPPADGVCEVDVAVGLDEAREAAGAAMVFLNPAGPGGYQIDPEGAGPDPAGLAVPAPAAELVDPAGRASIRARIGSTAARADDLADGGRHPEAVSMLAAADRLGELMGDYLHRAEMMMSAARSLRSTGHDYAAGRLARYALLAAGLCARGRLEMEAFRLRAELS
ncbi:MAG: hypothetical protein ACYCTI_07350 [Acidimicrobiales bacterium]